MPSIAVLGGLLTDYIITTPTFPRLGESLDGKSLVKHPGGKGGNVAVAAARASGARRSEQEEKRPEEVEQWDVKMFGAVGDDGEGEALVDGLQKEGVDTHGVQIVKGEASGICVVFLLGGDDGGGGGESGNMAVPGANAAFRLPAEEFLSTGTDLLCLNLAQISTSEVVLPAIERARAAGVEVLLNPSPVAALEGIDTERWCNPSITLLILNESEALALCSTINWRDAAQAFLAMGLRNVIITLGAQGAYFGTAEGEDGIVEAEKLGEGEVVDTTGAGDAFAGAVAVEWLRGKKREGGQRVRRAVEVGCHAAAECVRRVGCR